MNLDAGSCVTAILILPSSENGALVTVFQLRWTLIGRLNPAEKARRGIRYSDLH
jgi:hypothetical protein